jgi:(2Fe-2S) ferredoxin
MGQALEEIGGTDEERDIIMADKLREASEGAQDDQKMALILKISHIGGHKYAGEFEGEMCLYIRRLIVFSGNVIIYTPQGQNSGTGIWYGRVSSHEVPAVVKHTIMEGKVLPEILRGGINMSREQGQSLLDW